MQARHLAVPLPSLKPLSMIRFSRSIHARVSLALHTMFCQTRGDIIGKEPNAT
jgi:hypothetical protein